MTDGDGGLTVTVVEDDDDLRDLVAEALRREGFKVIEVASGQELRNSPGAMDADLFVLDIGLPDASGLTLAREIQARSDAGILIASTRDSEIDKVVGLEIGADDYIAKPFSLRELIARVRSILRRRRPAHVETVTRNRILAFGGFELDLDRRALFGPDGAEIELTSAEFDLARTLAQNANRVLSRGQIMDAMHDREWAGYDRGIDGLVSRLRKKIAAHPDAGLQIKTVRGVGYMAAF